VDILVEIGGHTGDNRLKLVARGAAPIQISTWDYPCTTGSRNIAYHLTDANLCPSGSDRFFLEKLIRLPGVAMCYQPPRPSPRVSPLPALQNGFLTFAAFHSMSKLTPASIEMWAGVMRALPRSRLILHHLFEGHRRVSKAFRLDVEKTINELGISSNRLPFVGALPHFDT
jgi:predicted O-linked N-acetylglucosamine transferase (SPINDLY family)